MENTQPILRPANRFRPSTEYKCTNCGRKSLKTVKNDVLKVKKEDNPLQNNSLSLGYLAVLSGLMEYRRLNDLSGVVSELLLYVYYNYLERSKGLTSYDVAKVMKGDKAVGSESINIRKRLNTLVDHGMLSRVDRNGGLGSLYYPTIKAIKDLNEICFVK